MDAVDITVLRALHAWRKAGQAALLITVVKTWGSSPRPVGAMLALRVGAEMVGSVSGGCIEDDLFDRFREIETTPSTTVVRYGVTAEEAHRFGLPCGGTIELMLERNPCAEQLKQLLDYLDGGALVRRTVDCRTGDVQLTVVNKYAPLFLDNHQLTMYIGPRWRMLLIGAGVLAKYLAAIAQSTGFTVTVCDPRPEHTYSWNESEVPLLRCMPDDAVTAFRPDPSSCVVTLSHDPKLDDLAVLEALQSPAFYIGAIGSRQNNEARRARLMEHFEIKKETMQRLHGPIGLFIDSKTPAEIAVSIMAEIIAIKNGVILEPAMQISVGKQKKEQLERT
ncbi:XdhC family protein [Pseudomonas psychrophila]|uniref:XdhC family protein n=1 Tax=Pseudomonas psychrophila TaxID=122355 RepID=UPI0002E0278E|nr:XdhC family protein [Pseudomonas psychrophila]